MRLAILPFAFVLMACGDRGPAMDAASLAAGAPEWLKRYPNVAKVDSLDDWRADSVAMDFRTGDRASEVMEFYKASLTRAGFTVDDAPASGSMMGIGGGTQSHLRAERRRDGQRVQVELIALEVDSTLTMVHGRWGRGP